MIPGNINNLGLEDLDRLIADRVPEGKTIEYKSALNFGSDVEKKEFLADVSSFANTSGGDLVYGLTEDQGIPVRIAGLAIADVDLELRRIDNLIRDGIRPRITHAIRVIALPDGNKVLVVRVSKDWNGPHRIIFQRNDKFFARTSAGKYALDVDELRMAFTLSQSVYDKIRSFRTDRTIALANNETPVPFRPGGKIILHLLPFTSFGGTAVYDVLQYHEHPELLRPIVGGGGGGWRTRITLEGILSHSGAPSPGYTHIFRSGIIEVVEGTLLNIEHEGVRTIPSIAYEERIFRYFPTCLQTLRTLGVPTPIAVALTLTNVRGVQMSRNAMAFDEDDHPIDVDTISVPETVVERLEEDPATILRPMFDLVWNACGQARSRNFDAQGRWAPQQR